MNQKVKQIIIAAVIIIVAFIGYQMFFVNDQNTSTALVADSQDQPEFIDGQIILGLLNKLDKVTLDDSIFSNNIFVSLQSFERSLENQVSGRKNPFLPIGADISGQSALRNATTTRAR